MPIVDVAVDLPRNAIVEHGGWLLGTDEPNESRISRCRERCEGRQLCTACRLRARNVRHGCLKISPRTIVAHTALLW
jgi:hypothetical protein